VAADTNNPKRVAAGKKAYRRLCREGRGIGAKSKRKTMTKKGKKGYKRHSRVSKHYHHAKKGLMSVLKFVVLIGPALIASYDSYKDTSGTQGWKVAMGMGKFGSCMTGLMYYPNANRIIWTPEDLLIGWGPSIVYTGIKFGASIIPGGRGINPFAQISRTLG
jgi:hypothetical protein